jgi:hypothetical protein
VEIAADERGVSFKGSGSSTRLEWSRYQRLVEGPDVIVLVYGKDLVHPVPFEAFATAADLETFRRLASSGIGVRPAGTPRTSR